MHFTRRKKKEERGKIFTSQSEHKMPQIKPWEKLPSSTSSSNRAKGLALGAAPQVLRFLGLAMTKAKSKKAWHYNQVKDGRRWRMMTKSDTFIRVLKWHAKNRAFEDDTHPEQ